MFTLFPETTAERIDDLVRNSGKSLSVVAKEIGVSPSLLSEIRNADMHSTLSEYEKRRNIGSANLIKICNYFGVSADYLLCLSDVQTRNETIQGINQITGLSENAIIKLKVEKAINESAVADFVSYLISNEDFSDLITALNDSYKVSPDSNVTLDNPNGVDYEVNAGDVYNFIVNRLFQKIIAEYQKK